MNIKKIQYERFNSGIAYIYHVTDKSKPGFRAKITADGYKKFHFQYMTIGVKRNYEAQQAGIRLDELISIPQDRNISTQDICMINDIAYEIKQVQHKLDTKPATTWLSLIRTEAAYEFLTEGCSCT